MPAPMLNRRPLLPYFVLGLVGLIVAGLVLSIVDHYRHHRHGASQLVAFGQVEQLLGLKCSGCHPGVVASLDLRPGHAYAALVGVRSIEQPDLVRVVAGDPDHSFLYLKIAGWPGNGANPIVGGRMPFGQSRLASDQIALVRRWILQGARNSSGQTAPTTQVATPGSVAALAAASVPQVASGNATITGHVLDDHHRPLPGAFVTMLIIRKDLPFGEDHYLAAQTDASGAFTIRGAPAGRIAIKAYAPGTVYVTRILDTTAGAATNIEVGLPLQAFQNPLVSAASVTPTAGGLRLAMHVTGASLDRNYTLAVNPASGRVFELRANPPGSENPGVWSRVVTAAGVRGGWVFFAVSHLCNTSNFITVAAKA